MYAPESLVSTLNGMNIEVGTIATQPRQVQGKSTQVVTKIALRPGKKDKPGVSALRAARTVSNTDDNGARPNQDFGRLSTVESKQMNIQNQ